MLDLRESPYMLDAWHQVWAAQLKVLEASTEAAGRMAAAFVGLRIGDITVYFPFGSGFHQDIDPYTNWGWINSSRTNRPDVERDIAQTGASYGKQLGRMMDLLVSIAEDPNSVDQEKLDRVKDLKVIIDNIKEKHGIKKDN